MIDGKTVKKLSELSKISVSDEETSAYSVDLERIIGMIDKIRDFDVKKAPSSSATLKYSALATDEAGSFESESGILGTSNNEKDSAPSVPRVV